MAKQTGLGDNVYLDGYNISNDVGQLSNISSPRGALELTGVDKSAIERAYGRFDGAVEFDPWMNPTNAHLALATLPTTDRQLSWFRGTAIGNPAACLIGKQLGYDGKRTDKGELSYKVGTNGNGYGLEWADQLTAGVASQGAAGALASYDYTATPGSTSFGLQAYLHVFSITGTSVTVHIQHSNDDGSIDPYADVSGAVFTAAAAAGAQRIATATNATVKRYVRVNTTGTFSAATFAVAIVKNLVTPVF